jgi:hypothetical protein
MLIVHSETEDLMALGTIESLVTTRATMCRITNKSIDIIDDTKGRWSDALSIASNTLELILSSCERVREANWQSHLPSTCGRKHAMEIACK